LVATIGVSVCADEKVGPAIAVHVASRGNFTTNVTALSLKGVVGRREIDRSCSSEASGKDEISLARRRTAIFIPVCANKQVIEAVPVAGAGDRDARVIVRILPNEGVVGVR
jgi:hypothetical protein